MNIGSKSANPILSLISQFDSIDDAVKGINEALSAVFSPSSVDSYSINEVGTCGLHLQITPRSVLDLLKRTPLRKASAGMP